MRGHGEYNHTVVAIDEADFMRRLLRVRWARTYADGSYDYFTGTEWVHVADHDAIMRERDQPELFFTEDALLAIADAMKEYSDEAWKARYEEAQREVEWLRSKLDQANADVRVMVRDVLTSFRDER